jgi:hypothetical protein
VLVPISLDVVHEHVGGHKNVGSVPEPVVQNLVTIEDGPDVARRFSHGFSIRIRVKRFLFRSGLEDHA